MNSGEFPHSEISGSKDVCSSPKLIAAYHVFHRLPVPRHSPCALCSLTVVYLSINISYFRFSICQRDFTILLSNLRSSVPLGEIIDFIKNQEFYIANKISFCSSIFSFQGTSVLRTSVTFYFVKCGTSRGRSEPSRKTLYSQNLASWGSILFVYPRRSA